MARRRRQPKRRQPQRRARPYRRSRRSRNSTNGDIVGRTFRRTIMVPWLPESAKKSEGNWLTTLKLAAGGIVPIIAKTVVRSFTSTSSLNQATSLPTAAICAFTIDSNFILATSPFVFSTSGGGSTTSGYCRWQQVKLTHLHIKLTPSEKVSSRGGTIAIAFVPCTISQLSGSVLDYKQYTFDEVLAIPGALTCPASRVLSYNYTPRNGDLAYDWQIVGVGTGNGFGVCVAAFSDLAASKKEDVVDNYMPDTLGIELSTHASVLLRAPLAQINYREVKLDIAYNNDPKSVFVEDCGIEIPAMDLELVDGIIMLKTRAVSFRSSCVKQDKSILSPATSLSTDIKELHLVSSDANLNDDEIEDSTFVHLDC